MFARTVLICLLLVSTKAFAQFYGPYNPLNGNAQDKYYGVFFTQLYLEPDSMQAWDIEKMRLMRDARGRKVFAAHKQLWNIGVGGNGRGGSWYGDSTTIEPGGTVHYVLDNYGADGFYVYPNARVGDTLIRVYSRSGSRNAFALLVDSLGIETLNGMRDTVKYAISHNQSPMQKIRLHRTQGWVAAPQLTTEPFRGLHTRMGAEGFATRFINYGSAEATTFSVGDEACFNFASQANTIRPSSVIEYLHKQRIIRIDTINLDSLHITLLDSAQLVTYPTQAPAPITIDTLQKGIRLSWFRIFDSLPYDSAGADYSRTQGPAIAGTTFSNSKGRGRWLDFNNYFEANAGAFYYNGWPLPMSYITNIPSNTSAPYLLYGDFARYFRFRDQSTGLYIARGERPDFITATRSKQAFHSLQLSPNPTTGTAQIRNAGIRQGQILIYDAVGRLCGSQPILADGLIPRSNLPSGLYQVVLTSSGKVWRGKLVWQ